MRNQHRECTEPRRQKGSQTTMLTIPPGLEHDPGVQFAFDLGFSTNYQEDDSEKQKNEAEGQMMSFATVHSYAFLAVEPGHMLVDTAAGEAIIGAEALRQLGQKVESLGMRVKKMPHLGGAPHGVGGEASVVCDAVVPITIAWATGLLKSVVLAADVPPLLPVLLLEHLEATIEVKNNGITWSELQNRVRRAFCICDTRVKSH